MKGVLLRDARPEVFALIKDKEMYFNITQQSSKKIDFICPRCGNIVQQIVSNVCHRGLSCKKCGDGISFGEKFIFNLLDQLNIDFDTHVSFPWSNNKIYDICIYDSNHIASDLIEIHGKQHYCGGFESYGGRNYLQEIENDDYKKELALQYGFLSNHYIIIDCRESTYTYIKNSIQSNNFFSRYDLNGVLWDECYKNALSSYSIKAQILWENGLKITEIANTLKIHRDTVREYLIQGAIINNCSYTKHDARSRGRLKTYIPASPIMVVCNELKSIFYSKNDAARFTDVNRGAINRVTSGKQKFAIRRSDKLKLSFKEIDLNNAMMLVENYGFKFVGRPADYITF